MAKKLSLLLAAVAVVALAVPALASAAAVTKSAGGAYNTGTILTGVSHNTTTTTEGLGTLECETVTIEASLTHNTGGLVEAESSGAGHTTKCFDEGAEIEITDATLIKLVSTAPDGSTGTADVTLTFIAHLPTVTCHFAGTVHADYPIGGHTLTISGEISGGGCGEAEINGEYTLSASEGVVLD